MLRRGVLETMALPPDSLFPLPHPGASRYAAPRPSFRREFPMSSIRKKVIVRYEDAKGKRCPSTTVGATKVVEESQKHYGFWTSDDGEKHCVALHKSHAKSAKMLETLMQDASLPAHLRECKRPISEHIAEFMDHVRHRRSGKRNMPPAPAQIRMVECHVRDAVAAISLRVAGDLDRDRVEAYLCRMLDDGPPVVIPDDPWFRIGDLAKILGRTDAVLLKHVRRHRLPSEGNPPRRRYPRATALVLLALRREGRGLGANAVAKRAMTLQRFSKYIARRCRMEDPLLDLSATSNAAGDGRHQRRPLTPEESARLLRTTLASPRTFRQLAGADRHALYSLALTTGFRRMELASLTTDAFRLDAATPHVYLGAGADKRGIACEQALPPGVLPLLRSYLAGREPGSLVWGGSWHTEAAWMIRGDLLDAGIPYAVDGAEGRTYIDFHGLRHSYIAGLDRAGLTLKVAMRLARHSTPVLTAKVYGRASLRELGDAVALVGLPEAG
jgi:integrase/recombinase XerC